MSVESFLTRDREYLHSWILVVSGRIFFAQAHHPMFPGLRSEFATAPTLAKPTERDGHGALVHNTKQLPAQLVITGVFIPQGG